MRRSGGAIEFDGTAEKGLEAGGMEKHEVILHCGTTSTPPNGRANWFSSLGGQIDN